jgi:hypothetical protein
VFPSPEFFKKLYLIIQTILTILTVFQDYWLFHYPLHSRTALVDLLHSRSIFLVLSTMDNQQSPAANPSLHPRGGNLAMLSDDTILFLRNLIPDDRRFIEECARRTRLGLWGYRPLTPAITPSSLAMESLPGLVLPEPLLPIVRSAADFSDLPDEFCNRHRLEKSQFFEERARWLSEFSPDDLINMWDETEAFDAQRAFPPGEDHEAQVRLWSQHQEGPSGTHTAAPSNESRLQQGLTGVNRARFGGTSSIRRTAVSAFLSGILMRGGSTSNEDGRAGNNSFSVADMARHIRWAPLPIIRRDETLVESSGERDFADDTTLVEDSEDSDFDFNDDSGYDPDSEDSEFNYSPFGDSPNDEPESASEDIEISDFADDETTVEASESQFEYGFLANPPAGGYYRDLCGQLGLDLHVRRVELPEYSSPYGVSVTVREVPEDELSDAEAEVSRDEASTPSAPPQTEVGSEEQRAPIPSNVDRQFREHLERDADIVLTYYDDEGQLHFVDEADGDVEYVPRRYGIDEEPQRQTRNGRVPLRSWNGLRRMGSRMPSPVSSSRTSGIRRRFGAVVDKVKKWFRK